MAITLNAEQERMIEEEIRSGHFSTPAEVLDHALLALREKTLGPIEAVAPRRKLVEVLSAAPFAGSELNIERQRDYPRHIEL